jgi:hypothetical protein
MPTQKLNFETDNLTTQEGQPIVIEMTDGEYTRRLMEIQFDILISPTTQRIYYQITT